MPELPEVETVRRGIAPVVLHQGIQSITVRQPQLRYRIPTHLNTTLPGLHICNILRRSKYLILETELGSLIIHLGMSGRLHALKEMKPPAKHDHADIFFENGICLRYHDPRRFGMILWTYEAPMQHPLLAQLGPEPLTNDFNADYLFTQAQKRNVPVKHFIMDNKVVVGVGNIYASESLFQAAISPQKTARTLSKLQCQTLVNAIKNVLQQAILAGGTTLKDFSSADGTPGYFQQELFVYGREQQHCLKCNHGHIKKITQGQRSTFYCSICQS